MTKEEGLKVALDKQIDTIELNNREIDLLKKVNKNTREDMTTMNGKHYGMGVATGIMIATCIVALFNQLK